MGKLTINFKSGRISNRFTKGSGLYECRCCGRKTRDTGNGDNESVRLCVECYDLSGEENSLSDTGKFHSTPTYILELIKAVHDKGGNATVWREIGLEAIALVEKE